MFPVRLGQNIPKKVPSERLQKKGSKELSFGLVNEK